MRWTNHLLDPLVRLLWPPPTGRHRPPCARCPFVREVSDLEPGPAPGPPPAPETYLHGEDSPLVRPYLVAHERQADGTRRQRGRSRTLRLAVHGIDIGPRGVHGREVTA